LLVAAMDKRSHWPFSVKKFPPSFDKPKPFEIKTCIIKTIYEKKLKENLGNIQLVILKSLKRDVR
jgi:hypothetical protein